MALEIKSISNMTDMEIRAFEKSPQWGESRSLFTASEGNCSFTEAGSYEAKLPWRLKLQSIFEALKPGEVYLDIGAGEGKAMQEYLTLYPSQARAIGISKYLPYKEESLQELIRMDRELAGFQYYLSDILTFPTDSLKGRVSVITDVMASFRYACDPVGVIRQMGEMLTKGGKAVISFGYEPRILVQDLVPERSCRLNSQQEKQGSKILMILWLHTIQGFKVIGTDNPVDARDVFDRMPDQVWKDCWSDDSVVLERTDAEVKMDPLTLDPTANPRIEDFERIETRYIWHVSEYTKKWLAQMKWLNG